MTPQPLPTRRGITLTEILISIMIMGIGLVSLAALFPVGLERLRQGQRNSRSALLRPAAIADLDAKTLLSRQTFDAMPWYGLFPHNAGTGIGYDPWVQDVPLPSGATFTDPVDGQTYLFADAGAYRGRGVTYTLGALQITEKPRSGPGLPVCYDPLWWSVVFQTDPSNVPPFPGPYPPITSAAVSRFGRSPSASAIAPSTGDGGTPSAFGLPRLTNAFPLTQLVVPQTFVSPDDMVLQEDGELSATPFTDPVRNETHTPWVTGSPILPMIDFVTDAGSGAPLRVDQTFDYSFTWMFTGQRVTGTEETSFVGDIVVFHNRPFALDTGTDPISGQAFQAPAGERVVEAVFGYGGVPRVASVTGYVPGPVTMGYSPNARSVLLRWNNRYPDPEVRVGSWIADVTYEQFSTREDRFTTTLATAVPAAAEFYPAQRCHWYRVTRVSNIEDETANSSPPTDPGAYRRMVVTIETPVKSKTLVWGPGTPDAGSPVFTNVALISPYIVNVFPVSFRGE